MEAAFEDLISGSEYWTIRYFSLSLPFSALSWCFLANSVSPLDVVQAIYKSNFWKCPTPFRLGLDRKREG